MLSIIIPAYNAAAVITDTISRINDFFGGDAEIIVVNDGSDDATGEILSGRDDFLNLRVINFAENRGKGAAVKAGVLTAGGEYIAFTDADLPYGLEPLKEMQNILQGGAVDIIVGSRAHAGAYAVASNGPLRQLTSFFWRVCIDGLTGEITDTQCGIKIFRVDAARQIFRELATDGFAFDVEILAAARRYGFKISAFPVAQVRPSRYSTVRVITDGVQMAKDLIKIRRRYQL